MKMATGRVDIVLAAARRVARKAEAAAERATESGPRGIAWLTLSRSREALAQARFAFEHSRAVLCARPDERQAIEAVRAELARAAARVNAAMEAAYAARAVDAQGVDTREAV